ncbi:MAG TPA: hypothetical protein VFT06_00360 [Flavisolibacter sp.]|nr:hypothetical protein [Flavisolibacter sp.]
MLNHSISVPAIVEMMIAQKTWTHKYNGTVHHAFTEDALRSLVEQILQICSNNSGPSATIAANSMLDGAKPEPLALAADIQQLIDKYEAEKKKAFENMQLMKGHEQYPWYEATWNNCLLFIHSLEDLKIKANAYGG